MVVVFLPGEVGDARGPQAWCLGNFLQRPSKEAKGGDEAMSDHPKTGLVCPPAKKRWRWSKPTNPTKVIMRCPACGHIWRDRETEAMTKEYTTVTAVFRHMLAGAAMQRRAIQHTKSWDVNEVGKVWIGL